MQTVEAAAGVRRRRMSNGTVGLEGATRRIMASFNAGDGWLCCVVLCEIDEERTIPVRTGPARRRRSLHAARTLLSANKLWLRGQ